MLDIKEVRSNLNDVVSRLNKKHYKFDSELFLSIDQRRKALQIEAESRQAERNAYSKNIGSLIHQARSKKSEIENICVKIKLVKKR